MTSDTDAKSLIARDRPNDEPMIPQAIVWRKIRYFTSMIHKVEDDLDSFFVGSFDFGNWSFDVREYFGGVNGIVSVFFPQHEEIEEVRYKIDRIAKKTLIPSWSIAWRRGDDYTIGKLKRPTRDRLTETEARVLALKIASHQRAQEVSTSLIKNRIPDFIQLSDTDMRPSKTRPREQKWQQIVGNIVSHQGIRTSPFQLGYAVRTQNGLRLTKKGVDYLKSLGYLS